MSRGSRGTMLMLDFYEKGYRVSENGELLDPSGKVTSAWAGAGGYLVKSRKFNGTPSHFKIHRLAAYQKYGEAMFEPGIEVRHLNNVKTDNSLNNIAIGTPKQNHGDMSKEARIKRSMKGSLKARIPDEIRARIISEFKNGANRKSLREKYRISRTSMVNVLCLKRILRFSDKDIRDIRMACKYNSMSVKELAYGFGVSGAMIYSIKNREFYKHVD